MSRGVAAPPRERFDAKYCVDDNGCWIWTAQIYRNGYGAFWDGERMTLAHRFAYEHFVGPVSDGLDLDHLCRVRECCNPRHLEPVTRLENLLRGETLIAAQVGRTECPRGHAYDAANTRVDRKGCRHCRKCDSNGASGRKREREGVAA